jgi:hypothetical protein
VTEETPVASPTSEKPAPPAAAARPVAVPVTRVREKPALPAAVKRAAVDSTTWIHEKLRSSSRRSRLIAAVIVAVIVVTGGGWWMYSAATTGANTPGAAALRMMQAYGDYDAAGLLANATHGSLTTAAQAALEQQYASAKAASKGPAVKDITVTKVTIDPKDPDSATVRISEQILDPNKGTYSPRTDTLSLVKQNGTWLVRLF